MKKDNSCEKVEAAAGNFIFVVALAYAVVMLAGCVGPLVFGLKSYTGSDGSRMDFITGADFTIGANGIDSVANNRGIEPKKYQKNGQ